MLDARLYGHWDSLTEGHRTGEPQNEAKAGGSLFDAIYSDPEKLRGFLKAMTGTSAGVARAIASSFPWERYRTVMLIETPGGFDYTGADCQGWMRDAGFHESYVQHHTPASACDKPYVLTAVRNAAV